MTNSLESFESLVAELSTLGDWVRYITSSLHRHQVVFGHGWPNAFSEACCLVKSAAGLPMDAPEFSEDALLVQFGGTKLLLSEKRQLWAWLQQRIVERKPLAYLTKEAWLQGFRFYVDDRVLIPRSPIAELLVQRLAPWIDDPDQVLNVLDMCTGSGCLAILAALAFPQAMVDAVDLSADALLVAEVNREQYALQDRLRLIQGDGFGMWQSPSPHEAQPDAPVIQPERYDVILCNPPYVNADSMTNLPAEYLAEPRMALASGEDGMDFVASLLSSYRAYLKPDGVLILEIGHEVLNFEQRFPDVHPMWLEVSSGEQQVMLIRA